MKKILFIFLPITGIILLLGIIFIITSLSSNTSQEDCGVQCTTSSERTVLENNLAATLQIVLDKTVPVINYNEKLYEISSEYQTLVQQVLLGVDDSGYILEYGVTVATNTSEQETVAILYPEYFSLTVKYAVSGANVSMTFLDNNVDGTVDEVYLNDVQITEQSALTDAQTRYEAELGITAAYYFGVEQ